MNRLIPLRSPINKSGFQSGDVLVLFGELFQKGYANGLVAEAEKHGLTIVRTTVGRRDEHGNLRPLNESESQAHAAPFINIPLEAGFDFEKSTQGISPCDQLKDIKLSNWQEAKLDWSQIKESHQKGTERFKESVRQYLKEVEQHIPPGRNVIFAHLMAGGVPRSKIIMSLMNRVFKGTGDRHISSQEFWHSDLGKLCEMSFNDVTADTFKYLLELSTPLKNKIEQNGGQVRYLAYGYHGTEILIHNSYLWQTYTPYLQGFAKLKLETIAEEFWNRGYKSSVYNCPEILTNSSSIFIGVEVSLYALLESLDRIENKNNYILDIISKCKAHLKDDSQTTQMKTFLDKYMSSSLIREHCDFKQWPQHNSASQMEYMIQSADALIQMHKDEKNLITFILSEAVFKACGELMFHKSWTPESPVWWLGHEVISQQLALN